VDLVITEDSDLIAYGVTRLLFKMNHDGTGDEVDMRNFDSLSKYPLSSYEILMICVLSGCDYLKSIRGISFKTAMRIVQDLKSKYPH